MEEKVVSIISYIVIMIVTILVASYVITFLVQRSATCDEKRLDLCATENLCEETEFYWWDNSCHLTKPEPPICGKEYIYLCTTENLCEEIEFYWWDDSCHSSKKPKPKPSEYPDYDFLPKMKQIILVQSFASYSPEAEATPKDTVSGVILREGKIAKGYIEFIASMDGQPLTVWESIYFKAPYNKTNHYDYGGHIFRPLSLKIPPNGKTHILFPLNSIPFLPYPPYSESLTPKTVNLFDIINQNDKTTFLIFISSLAEATLDSVKVYYQCEIDSECELKPEEIF